ncbi:MAG: TIM barrel protein [Cyclobacteriaceae bacterium]
MNRRKFTNRMALGLTALPVVSSLEVKASLFNTFRENTKVPLGIDAHAVRAMKWNATQLVDYAIKMNVDSLLLNGLEYFESLDDKYLKGLKKTLDKNNVSLYFGVGGLSINSPSYSDEFGNPKELITQGIRLAKIFNAPSVNCRIGSIKDRFTDGGIIARMEEIINALRSMRTEIQDAGVKFAVENHAGDMRSEELLNLVETVGTDVCGVMLDPGNSVWSMENPMTHLEKLGKHVLCTSIRDYKIWESEKGATFQWRAIGEGDMDFLKYTQRMSQLCPGVPLQIETISSAVIEIPYLTKEYWEAYPDLKAADLLEFYSLVRNEGAAYKPENKGNKDKKIFQQETQEEELVKSINYLKKNCDAIQKRK